MNPVVVLLLLALAGGPGMALAKVEVLKFDTPEQEATYDKLVTELRCLVCQNQNLADSNAELAVDMRRKTYEMVMQDKSVAEISDFMVDRYGEFVLYRPPLNSNTVLLWVGPFVILALGIFLLLRTIQKRRRQSGTADLSPERMKTAAALLDGDHDKRDA
jgi:cytochrome c-type biogenesis protein CcmH